MARAFEVAGVRVLEGKRRHPPSWWKWGAHNVGVGWEALLILLLISSRPIPRVDLSCGEKEGEGGDWGGGDALGRAGKKRRGKGEGKRKKKDLTAKGWQRRVPGFRGAGWELLRGARGRSYLFECVVARDKNDARESTKSMCRGAATTRSPPTPCFTLIATSDEIVEEKSEVRRRKNENRRCTRRDDTYTYIYWLSAATVGDCSGHFRFTWNRPHDEKERHSLGRFAPRCSRIDECKNGTSRDTIYRCL